MTQFEDTIVTETHLNDSITAGKVFPRDFHEAVAMEPGRLSSALVPEVRTRTCQHQNSITA